jgi:hypothetical protein
MDVVLGRHGDDELHSVAQLNHRDVGSSLARTVTSFCCSNVTSRWRLCADLLRYRLSSLVWIDADVADVGRSSFRRERR